MSITLNLFIFALCNSIFDTNILHTMKRTFWIFVALLLCTGSLKAQEMPTQKEILKTMLLVNDYFMKKWPDPSVPTFVKRERPSNLWTRAVY